MPRVPYPSFRLMNDVTGHDQSDCRSSTTKQRRLDIPMTNRYSEFMNSTYVGDSTGAPSTKIARARHDVVFTKSWVVELMLDLAGYIPAANLVDAVTIEPAAGEGAFLIAIVNRLLDSCERQARPITDCGASLIAYEIDPVIAARARGALIPVLTTRGIAATDAEVLVNTWVQVGDYLLEAPTLPRADFVIGNPPYVRLEEIPDMIVATYRRSYQTMIGRADLYIAFFEAALRSLKAGGVCVFICADRWMFNQYGAELRRLATSAYGVEAIVEMHTADAFEDEVSAYPAITVIRRGPQHDAVVASAGPALDTTADGSIAVTLQTFRTGKQPASLPKGLHAARVTTWFSNSEPWPFTSPERLALLKRLEAEFYPLESEGTKTKVGIGVATGADDVYIVTDPDLVESSCLLPLAMAADTMYGTLRWSGHYLVNPWEAHGLVDLARFPRLAAYFERHRTPLETRHVGQRQPKQWYRTIDRVNVALTSKPKLYIPDIKTRLTPVLDRGETYPHHNLYVVQSAVWDYEVLGGILISDVAQFFIECYGVRMRGGYFRFQAQYLRRIRVPRPHDVTPAQAAGLADAFRRRDRGQATQIACEVYGIAAMPEEEEHAHA